MKRSTRWMIFIVYYTAQILGLVGFSYKADSGKLERNIFITFYSGLISMLMFCIVPLFSRIQWRPRNANGPHLHFKISTVMVLIHIAAILITILLNWTKRTQFMETIREFQRLRRKILSKFKMSKRVEKSYEKSIRSKFFVGIISNIISFVLSYDILRGIFNVESSFTILVVGIFTIVLNIIMDQYFFALLNINVLLTVVNEEIERILKTSSVLFELQRLKKIKAGALIMTCCKLADELDDLAIQRCSLQTIGERINRLYELHGACVVLTLYMNNTSVIYMIYMLIQQEKLSEEHDMLLIIIALPLALVFFYTDLGIFTLNMLHFGDSINKTGILLNNHQSWLPTLDERLEKSLKDFSIQMALFPYQMKLLGLFQFNRSMTFATLGSTIMNAIVLIQYDYKYSEN